MRVLIATPLYPPDTGGPATDSAFLVKDLPKYGLETSVYSFGVVRHLPRGIRHVWYAVGLWKRSHNVEVIVAMDTFSVCLPAALVAKISRKCFVVRVPGDFAWEQSTQRFGVTDSIEDFQHRKYGLKVEFIRTFQRFAVQQADMVVACSDFLKRIVATWGIEPERLTRVYLGLDFAEPVTAPTTVPSGKILFSLGRFVPWKGFAMLLELLPDLPSHWHLVIVGDGPLRKPLEVRARILGISHRVLFPGVLPRGEVLGWYRRADAFVLNTSQENFSFQVLEAMAAGVPIITTTTGSLPELVTDRVEGVLCTPNDNDAFRAAIMSVEKEPEVWKHRTKAAQAKAPRFSSDTSAEAFAKVITHVCA